MLLDSAKVDVRRLLSGNSRFPLLPFFLAFPLSPPLSLLLSLCLCLSQTGVRSQTSSQEEESWAGVSVQDCIIGSRQAHACRPTAGPVVRSSLPHAYVCSLSSRVATTEAAREDAREKKNERNRRKSASSLSRAHHHHRHHHRRCSCCVPRCYSATAPPAAARELVDCIAPVIIILGISVCLNRLLLCFLREEQELKKKKKRRRKEEKVGKRRTRAEEERDEVRETYSGARREAGRTRSLTVLIIVFILHVLRCIASLPFSSTASCGCCSSFQGGGPRLQTHSEDLASVSSIPGSLTPASLVETTVTRERCGSSSGRRGCKRRSDSD